MIKSAARVFLFGRLFFSLLGWFVFAACGVKGDPLPPEQPPFIGRGHPNYKDALASDQTTAPAATKNEDAKAPKKGKATDKVTDDQDSDKDEDDDGED